jgi:hypothetical protein
VEEKITRLIPFTFESNAEGDLVCKSIWKATGKGYWMVEITINPITMEIVSTNCDCWANKMKPTCKHIKKFYEIIVKFKKEIGC